MRMIAFSVRDDEIPHFESLQKKYNCTVDMVREPLTEKTVHLVEGHTNVSVLGGIYLDEKWMEKLYAMGVKHLVTRSIGWDIMDTAAANRVGLKVSNISYSPFSVAEYALLQILLAARNMGVILQRVGKRDYSIEHTMGDELWDTTVGVIGTGRIGRALIQLLSGFGCRILAYDLYPSKGLENVEYCDLPTLLSLSDIISVHVPSTPENAGLFCKKTFDQMKDGVIFVNTARGDLMVTADLVAALESGKIGAAGLDVLAEEGDLFRVDHHNVPDKNPLITKLEQMDNVFLTPHIAFNTKQAIFQVVENCIKSILYFEKGEENPWQIKA